MLAAPPHISALMCHSFLRCKSAYTAISLESSGKIKLPIWLAYFTAADWLIGVYLSILRFNPDKNHFVWQIFPYLLFPLIFHTASKSRTGGRVHQQHFVQEDPGPPKGEGDLSSQLWEGGRVSHQWAVKETHASECLWGIWLNKYMYYYSCVFYGESCVK